MLSFHFTHLNSHNENSLLDSSSGSFNFGEWEERVEAQNQQIDHIIEDMLLLNHNLIVGDHTHIARRRHCDQDRELGEERLMNDYFVETLTYCPQIFRQRFRMQK